MARYKCITMKIPDCENLVLLWARYADEYAEVDPRISTRFRRLAKQMQSALDAQTLNFEARTTINLRQPQPMRKRMVTRSLNKLTQTSP